MVCPKCGNEMRIVGSGIEVKGDKSPDTVTEVYHVHRIKCVNPYCTNKQETEERSLIYKG